MSKVIKDEFSNMDVSPGMKWYLCNKDNPKVKQKFAAQARKQRFKNLHRHRKKAKEWIQNNREYVARKNKEWREAHPEKFDYANNVEYRNQRIKVAHAWRRRHPIRPILVQIRASCKKRGIPFDISEADLPVPTHCPVMGTPLIFTWDSKDMNRPSVDRVIPELGYVKGNVRVISMAANLLKTNNTEDTLRKILAYIEEHKRNCQ